MLGRMLILSLYINVLCIVFVKCDLFDEPVVFTVGQDAHVDFSSLANDTSIPFSVEITKRGGANLNNGVFTCTRNGLYKFQAYSLTKSDSALFLELYQNDRLVASLWGHTPGDYASAGNAVILSLVENDVVKMVSRSNYNVHIYGTPDQIYTVFSGVQLGSLVPDDASVSAFSVSLSQHENVTGGSPVLYNNVVTDVDKAYDPSTGVYTVPASGLYIFHFFSLAHRDMELWQELYHNRDYVCSLYGKTDVEYADAGNTVLLHLKQNDHVTVKAHTGRNNNLFGTPAQIYSTFSGAQIVTETNMYSGDLNTVAFSVGLSHLLSVPSGTNVVFDRIFLNIPTVYDHTTGEFTAPVSGLYEFNYHSLAERNGKMWLDLYHNYRYVDSLYSHTPEHYATAGNTAVIELDVGDTVVVRAHIDQDLYGTSSQIYCTFTGYLLHAYPTNQIIG